MGVFLSLAASTAFATLYYYSTLLQPLGGIDIYAWRIVMTAPCLTLLVLGLGRWSEVRAIVTRLRTEPRLWLLLPLSSALLGVQLWLFMWAPNHGYGLDVALGYFLLPLTLVLAGRLLFRERVSRLKGLACLLAALGVGNELLENASISWTTLLAALGYTVYFCVRRWARLDSLGGLWFDMVLAIPAGLALILLNPELTQTVLDSSRLAWLIPGLGLLSAAALALMVLSSRMLDMVLFGLLSYVEPILLVFVALLLGEWISPSQWITYSLIWGAIMVLVTEGVVQRRRYQRQRTYPA